MVARKNSIYSQSLLKHPPKLFTAIFIVYRINHLILGSERDCHYCSSRCERIDFCLLYNKNFIIFQPTVEQIVKRTCSGLYRFYCSMSFYLSSFEGNHMAYDCFYMLKYFKERPQFLLDCLVYSHRLNMQPLVQSSGHGDLRVLATSIVSLIEIFLE